MSAIFRRVEGAMMRETEVSAIEEQLKYVSERLEGERFFKDDTWVVRAVLESLRETQKRLKDGSDLLDDESSEFQCKVDSQGEHTLSYRGRWIPIRGSYLVHLFSYARVSLWPGQRVILDPRLVKDAVEEALGQMAFDEALVRKRLAEASQQRKTSLPAKKLGELADSVLVAEMEGGCIRRLKRDLVGASLRAEEMILGSKAA